LDWKGVFLLTERSCEVVAFLGARIMISLDRQIKIAIINQIMKDRQSLPLPVVADSMRARDRVKPGRRLAPRQEALPSPQISRPVRGVRPEACRSNATHTPDAISNNLQLVNCSE